MLHTIDLFAKNVEAVSSIDEINEKACLLTDRLECFTETFRALSVARGHSFTGLLA